MFDYTQTQIKKIAMDFKRLGFWISLATQLLMIFYFCYAIGSGTGNLLANIVLAILSAAYFVFYIATRNMTGKNEKKMKKLTKKALKYSKFFIKTMTLGGLVYSAVIASGNINVVDIVLIGLSLIGWILQVLFEVVVFYVETQFDMISLAFKMDVETLMKPVTAVGNTIKKFTGKQIEQPILEKPEKRAKLERLKNLFMAERNADKKDAKSAVSARNAKVREDKPMLLEEKVSEEKKAESSVNK